MPETLREAVLRIKTEFDQKTVKPPDLSGVKADVSAAGQAMESTFKTLTTQIAETQQKLTAFAGAADFDEPSDEVKALTEDLQRLEEQLDKTKKEATDSAIKMNEGFIQSAEGLLTLTRGMTLLGISSEDDLAKVVQQLAKVQGAMDLFKGAQMTVKGVIEGFRGLRAAITAAGIAGTASAASIMAALGPIALALAGIAAAWAFFKDDAPDQADEATEAIKRQNEALAENRKRQQEAREAAEDFAEGLRGSFSFKGLLGDDAFRSSGPVIGEGVRSEAAVQRAKSLEAAREHLEAMAGIGGGLQVTLEELEDHLQGLADEWEAAGGNMFKVLESLQGVEAIQRLQLEQQQSRLEVERALSNEVERQLKADRDRLNTLTDQIKARREELEAFQSSIGALSPEAFAEAQDLLGRVETEGMGAVQTQEQAELLEKLIPGFLAAFQRAQAEQLAGGAEGLEGFRKRAQAAAENVGVDFGVQSEQDINRAAQDVERAAEALGEQRQTEAEMFQSIVKQAEEFRRWAEANRGLFTRQEQFLKDSQSLQDQLVGTIERLLADLTDTVKRVAELEERFQRVVP